MDITVTDEAVEVLQRSLKLGSVDPATGGIRLRVARALGGGTNVQVELAGESGPGESVIELEGLRLFVDGSVGKLFPRAVVAVEPQHENIVVRSAEAPEDL